MINKKIVALTLAAGLASSGILSSVSAFAAEQTKDTPVSYSSAQNIPDPENPDAPDYVVNVPASITFTDNNKTIDTTVSMTNPDGSVYAGAKSAGVKVASKNNYKLKNGNHEVDYKLTYAGNVMSAVAQNIGTLNKTSNSVAGKAQLVGTATATGNYTDVLTYTVTSN